MRDQLLAARRITRRTADQVTDMTWLNPLHALRSYWAQSSPEAHLAVGGGGFIGWCAQIPWAAILGFAGVAAMTIGGTAMELYKRYRFMQLEIREKERELDAKSLVVGLQPDTRPDRQAGGLRPSSL
jgi:hypothetical protein